MSKCINLFVLLLLVSGATSCKKEKEVTVADSQKPNIIYILADDLGYGDVGAYGQTKIETPNIDGLAKKGMLFTQHYSSAPVCAPARYMLMTGLHAGHSFIRGNHEWGERGKVWDYKEMIKDSTLEGQHPMPDSTITMAKRLQSVGYKTALVGKWGLGAPHTNSVPNKMGFDFFVGFNCQRQAHTYYPLHLYKNLERIYINKDTVPPNTKLAKNADPNNPDSYAKYTLENYAPDVMFDELTGFVKENKDNPFFLYWASPIPHVALQAPKRWVDYYKGKFGEEEPYLGQRGYFPHQNPRAAYAAMVSYFDENIGKLIQQLKDEGVYDNTLIIFTSDNGPSYAGGADSEYFNSARPFDNARGRTKGFVHEGGIRVPMIASWPGHIAEGSKTNHPSAHYDVLATMGELTGFEMPKRTDGVSFLPTLLSNKSQKEHPFMYWEFPESGGQIAIRKGDWKLIRKNLKSPKGKATLELYNLKVDSLELNNVAEDNPKILAEIEAIFNQEHEKAQVERFVIPILEEGLLSEK